jgi:hypothetical protein
MVGVQAWAGAYRAELCAFADEPAHAVTGVAFEQYLLHSLPESPKRFLVDYYQHYPKVAVGHWPPLLYVAEAAVMLVVAPSKYALLGLQALLAGILAWLVFRELKPLVGALPAVSGSLALLLNPQFRIHASMAMTESLLTLTIFGACLAFVRFAERQETRDAILFALWLSAAVLTKGTGWAVLLVIPAVLLATRNWKLAFAPALRPAALLVAALCLPWQILTFGLVYQAWFWSPGAAYSFAAAPQFAKMLFTLPGLGMAGAALIGASSTLIGDWKAGRTRAYWAALAGLIGAAWLFHVIIPAGIESRMMIIALPPILILAAAGAGQLAWRIAPRRQRQAAGAIYACLALVTIAISLPVEAKPQFGFIPVAEALDSMMPPGSAALLVSDALGEGAIISEVALRRPSPSVYLLRGTKVLASQNWLGRDYRSLVHSGDECARLLASVPIDVLVVDRRRSADRQPFFDYVEAMLQSYATEWRLAKEFQTPGDSPHAVAIYCRRTGIESVRNLPRSLLARIPADN